MGLKLKESYFLQNIFLFHSEISLVTKYSKRNAQTGISNLTCEFLSNEDVP